MTLIAVAASLAIIGLICIKSGVIPLATPATTLAYKPTSVDEILSREVSGPSVEVVDDRADLDKKLSYDLKYLHLDDWQMQSAGIYKMAMAPPIALFDFVGKDADASKMRCYQAPLGTFKSDATTAEVVDDKSVRFGSHQDRNYALWSQNGRDYLLVTPLSRDKRTEIVRKA